MSILLMPDDKPEVHRLTVGRDHDQSIIRETKEFVKSISSWLFTSGDKEFIELVFFNCKNCGKRKVAVHILSEAFPEVCCENKRDT